MSTVFFWMEQALQQARNAYEKGEVPVGAVLVYEGAIIAKAHNRMQGAKNPLDHAEYLVLKEGLQKTRENHLRGCSLFVTLEPCAMCAGAIDLCGISHVYYGAYDPKMGQIEHNGRLLSRKGSLDRSSLTVCGGIYEHECSTLLKDFFKKCRMRS